MSSLNLAKKLKPAKKAWKRFINTLQSKLTKLKIPKSIKKTSCITAPCPLIPRKPPNHRLNRHHHRVSHLQRYPNPNHHQVQSNYIAAIYVDELFPSSTNTSTTATNRAKAESRELNMEKQKRGRCEKGLSRKSRVKAGETSIEEAWKTAVSSLPQLQCVDERAEEFISKFREDMKLQREQSILEFQEMLARGA